MRRSSGCSAPWPGRCRNCSRATVASAFRWYATPPPGATRPIPTSGRSSARARGAPGGRTRRARGLRRRAGARRGAPPRGGPLRCAPAGRVHPRLRRRGHGTAVVRPRCGTGRCRLPLRRVPRLGTGAARSGGGPRRAGPGGRGPGRLVYRSGPPAMSGGTVIADEQSLVHRLANTVRRGRRVALVLGSGVTTTVVPGVPRMLDLADEFAAQIHKNPDLSSALANARAANPDRPAETYAAYRRIFTALVSPEEFDIVVQRAVLEAHRPPGSADPTWERIGFQRGMQLEGNLESWRLPDGVAALGAILARLPAGFGHRVLTTNFDPLIEIAVRRAGGRAHSVSLVRDGSLSALVAEEGAVSVI